MRMAPIDIAHKSFNRKVMGFDQDEVQSFLRDLAEQLEELVRERNALKEALRQKEMSIIEYKERDETLKATLSTATRMSEQIRHDAEREAKLIVADASQRAEMVMKDGRDQLKRVFQEIAELRRLRTQFEVNLRALIQAHQAMLEQSHATLPDPNVHLQSLTQAAQMTATQAHAAAPGNQAGHHSGLARAHSSGAGPQAGAVR
jgi:cell division initiation protein